jgi:UDP-N-acetylglucosamine diphosphorylase/glucosamine-1-phosphate N-acetyltransferase
MPTALHLYDPPAPGDSWFPFAGARPISELRAGIWRIRERWEGVLEAETVAIMADHVAGFHEFDEPEVVGTRPVKGPAVVAASWFAPSGTPIEYGNDTRRLTHEGQTVAWLVAAGQTWTGPNDDGAAVDVEGMLLEGSPDLLTACEGYLQGDCADFLHTPHDPIPDGCLVIGDPAEVIILGGAVEPGVVFDVRYGAIVIEEGAEIRSGTRLEGPLYAGAHCRILGGHLSASVLGPHCRVKGELSHSVFLGYSNKGHDGFVGHSVLGTWVNLGAMTTTSNLKNTYGEVQVEVAGTRFPTGRQFVGTIFGDHAKLGIGTLLSTGTMIGAGANVFGPGPVPKYVPPFAWGGSSTELMDQAGFLRVAERVMPRRQIEFTAARKASLAALWQRLAPR